MRWTSSATGVLLALLAAPVVAEEPWALCPAWPEPQPGEPADASLDPADAPVVLDADVLDGDRDGESVLTGSVELRQGRRTMSADRLVHEHESGTIRAQGAIRYHDGRLSIESGRATLERENERVLFEEVDFRLHTRRAGGTADSLSATADGIVTLEEVRYTTCPAEDEAWVLNAPGIELDTEAGVGTGRNVWLRFKGVPIFYTPWFSFPLDDTRKSGILMPDVGRARNTGIDIHIPWYWNIAPNLDATLTPRLMEERGVQLGTEFRYLFPGSAGTTDIELLPDDRVTGETRGRFAWRHAADPATGWQFNVDFDHVTDRDYFEDLAGSLDATVITHLRRSATVAFHGDRQAFTGRLDGWQTLDDAIPLADRPYSRLPQLLWRTHWDLAGPRSPRLDLATELVRFHAGDARITGTRLDLQPALSWPWVEPAWFVVPRVAMRHTRYSLDEIAPGADDGPTRTLPIYSVDAGLAFERTVSDTKVQTLQPRIQWLRIPYRDQAALPLFDTSLPELNMVRLFSENRYNGADRIGDTEQVTLGVGTAVHSAETGERLYSVQVGRIRYLDDRRVTLPGEPDTADEWSDVIAEADAKLAGDWSGSLGFQFDTEAERFERSAVALRWRPAPAHSINLGWRFRRGEVDQTDIGFAWPLSARWSAFGRWNYSVEDNESIETFFGLEYQSCCWAARILSREYIANRAGDTNRSLYFQLELKGLANVGRGIEALLERGILGHPTNR